MHRPGACSLGLARTDYNYFSSRGSGCGGPIRITDIYGQQLTVDQIALRPNVAQQTRVPVRPPLTGRPSGRPVPLTTAATLMRRC
jgi:hypothetical protein